jgi:hypothetical protein
MLVVVAPKRIPFPPNCEWLDVDVIVANKWPNTDIYEFAERKPKFTYLLTPNAGAKFT